MHPITANIKKIIRKRISDTDKITLINQYLNSLQEEKTLYGLNELVALSNTEYSNIELRFGKDILIETIHKLDSWLYKGKTCKSHYLTLLNWIRREGVKELPKTYICSSGTKHKQGEECDCIFNN